MAATSAELAVLKTNMQGQRVVKVHGYVRISHGPSSIFVNLIFIENLDITHLLTISFICVIWK